MSLPKFPTPCRRMLTRSRGAARATVLALAMRGCANAMSTHAGASRHWEKLWAQDGGLAKGSRFDVAGVSLPLAAELARRPRSGLTALVPGCGRAYDALFLAEHGFESVVALDLSSTACEAAREEIALSSSSSVQRVTVECGDFFDLSGRRFDFIWDCTFLCALDPSMRGKWAAKQKALLDENGTLLTCVFPIGEKAGGPPYALSVPLVTELLEPEGFAAVEARVCEGAERHLPGAMAGDDAPGTALVAWRLGKPDAVEATREIRSSH